MSQSSFELSEQYKRTEIHDQYGGQRQSGISTPSEHPFIFLFTGDSGKEHGYEDEFRDDGQTFIYTGEGQVGDMEWVRGNKAVRDHRENGKQLHLFEKSGQKGWVTYLGEYEYVGYEERTLSDTHGNSRRGLRFILEPVESEETTIPAEEIEGLSLSELYERAKQSAENTGSRGSRRTSGASSSRGYTRSEQVKRYARKAAQGVCQGCDEEAPFIDKTGEPFLEVHHLYRRSDGGPDHPDNVIAICPNCHRRVHHGEDGETFNKRLKEERQGQKTGKQ